MPIQITETTVENVLTRTSGYLREVTSHSLQPYRGCTFGHSLCGVGCYVQHSRHILAGRPWGEFLEVRTNAADSYRRHAPRESRWAHTNRGSFSIFCSSATDPFVPQEQKYGITRALLEAMCEFPPDLLILQTHSSQVTRYLELYRRLQEHACLRIHISIESDQDRLPGLPPPASSVESRLQACASLKAAGIPVVVTVSPLLPISDPEQFFSHIAQVADAVVIDHYIEGDGSHDGHRTARTPLPAAMAQVDPRSITLPYRDEIAAVARRFLPGRVGISGPGFAGRYE